MAGGGSSKWSSKGVRIVVAGDRGTKKSSLIVTAAADTFPTNVPPVLPPTRLPDDMYPKIVPITVIDTSSSLKGWKFFYLGDLQQVFVEEAEEKARDLNVMFIETSAKAGFDIKALFRKIAAALPGMENLSSTKQDMVDVNLRSTGGNASQSQPQSGLNNGSCSFAGAHAAGFTEENGTLGDIWGIQTISGRLFLFHMKHLPNQ